METLHTLFGNDAHTITWWQMTLRAVLIFFFTLALVRFGGRRVFGKNTSFDIVVGVILGSTMSRVLTGNAPLLPTFAAATALIGLHWLLGALSLYSTGLARLVKGTELLLVENGEIRRDALRRANFTEHDLFESLRTAGHTTDLSDVKAAYLERNGHVSVVTH